MRIMSEFERPNTLNQARAGLAEGEQLRYRLASLALAALTATVLFHMCCVFDTPPERRTLGVVVGSTAIHLVWAGLFGWLSIRLSQGRRLTTAIVIICVNGAMTAIPTVLILARAFKYVGGWISTFSGILFWVAWIASVVFTIAATKTRVLPSGQPQGTGKGGV
jgi:hypothetical protein